MRESSVRASSRVSMSVAFKGLEERMELRSLIFCSLCCCYIVSRFDV